MSDTNANPSSILIEEHDVILRVLNVFERQIAGLLSGTAIQPQWLRQFIRFFSLFADKCHHAKEEDLLFPALERNGIPREGGPIGVMVWEHRMARQLIQEMADHVDKVATGDIADFTSPAQQYIELLRGHIDKENHCLFPMGDRALDNGDRKSLCEQFCQTQCRKFDGESREDLIRLADRLEKGTESAGDPENS